MTRKLYELVSLVQGRFSTRYMGVDVKLNFEPKGRHGQLITDCQFVQDAIENDPKFGSFFILKQEWNLDESSPANETNIEQQEQQDVEQYELRPKKKTRAEIFAENKARAEREAKLKAEENEKNAVGEDTEPTIVDSVKNVNDAAKWFKQNYGEEFLDAGQLTELCEKYNVKFPKYK